MAGVTTRRHLRASWINKFQRNVAKIPSHSLLKRLYFVWNIQTRPRLGARFRSKISTKILRDPIRGAGGKGRRNRNEKRNLGMLILDEAVKISRSNENSCFWERIGAARFMKHTQEFENLSWPPLVLNGQFRRSTGLVRICTPYLFDSWPTLEPLEPLNAPPLLGPRRTIDDARGREGEFFSPPPSLRAAWKVKRFETVRREMEIVCMQGNDTSRSNGYFIDEVRNMQNFSFNFLMRRDLKFISLESRELPREVFVVG